MSKSRAARRIAQRTAANQKRREALLAEIRRVCVLRYIVRPAFCDTGQPEQRESMENIDRSQRYRH
jgi:hypothetical protein